MWLLNYLSGNNEMKKVQVITDITVNQPLTCHALSCKNRWLNCMKFTLCCLLGHSWHEMKAACIHDEWVSEWVMRILPCKHGSKICDKCTADFHLSVTLLHRCQIVVLIAVHFRSFCPITIAKTETSINISFNDNFSCLALIMWWR